MLKINKKFAKKYDEYRRKEELQKSVKDKYGDVKLSQAKSATEAADASESSESSESSSDSEPQGWTPGTEAGFLRVYAALQSGDSRLYDPKVNWFQEDEEASDEAEDAGSDEAEKEEKHKPMYYNEFHRKFLLEGAYKAGEDSATAAAPDAEVRENLREAERIRDSLARAHANDSKAKANGKEGSEEEDEEDFLVKRRPGDQQANGEGDGDDPMLRLHRFVAEPSDSGDGLEPECKADLAQLKRHWTDDSKLTEAERYLRDFITKEFWRRPRQRQQQPAEAPSESNSEAALSEDEAFLTKQSEFESRWNGRTDERDPEFESGFQRTFASGDGQLDGDSDDDELFVAKKACPATAQELELDEQTAAELLRLEERRDRKPPQPAGENEEAERLPDDDDEAAGGEAGEAGIRSYPRRIGDSLRQSTADADRSRRRAELRERRRADRLARRREFDAAARMKAAELERRLERLRRNAGIGDVAKDCEGEDEAGRDRLADTLGGDFLDEDFDPAEHDRRMASLFGEDFYGEAHGDEKAAKKPQFSEDEDEGEGETGESILLADDRELNSWCSVRKASQYREREADWRDRRRFRSARAQERKTQLMPGMMKRLEAAAAYPDAKAWAAAAAAGLDLAGELAGAAVQKKRRRKKRKQQQQQQAKEETGEDAEQQPRSRKKRRLLPEQQVAAVGPQAAESATTSQKQKTVQQKSKKHQKQKKKPGSDGRLQISEQRLAELGIDPRQFRRMQKQKKASAS
uniref:Protein KRI1 homolog n=1 Tax=Macrostomum lignano TaxID=282301 RepID=A0A1I8HK54_9PLAT